MIEIPDYLLENKKPFFVCSRSVLEEQVESLRRLGVDVFYSTKTNPEQVILKELNRLQTGFSVSNPEDFLSVIAVGADKDKICYHERGLTKERAGWLVRAGCKKFVIESKSAFENLEPLLDEDSTVLVRLKAGSSGNKYAGNYIPGVETGDAKNIISKCKEIGAKTGVLHHSSSQMGDAEHWRTKFEGLSKFDVDIINIGGGMPISYSGESQENVLEAVKEGIKGLDVKIIAEPGRFIVGPACSLVARIDLVDGENVVLNCSAYNVHIDTIIASLVLPSRTLGNGPKQTYRLLGSSLCNLDVFDNKAELPELAAGDIIILDKAGAYNISSEFGAGSGVETYIID